MRLNLYKILTSLVFSISILSFPVYADGVKVIIVGSDYDRHNSYSSYGRDFGSDYGKSHRLRNKHYFDNRYRSPYGNRYYGYGRNNYQNNHYRNNYRYSNRNYYRSNRSYCPN